MTTINISGREYPMALTLGAMSQLDEMCGGFDHVSDAFDGKTTMQVVDTLVQMLSILIRGGCDYQRGMGLDAPEPLRAEALQASLLPKDIAAAKDAIFRAMAESMGRTVDVETDSKNAGATQDG